MRRRPVSSQAFTVPEMLAVVAVIMIVMSILLPSMGRSRDVARKAICASNLHQQGLAMINYTINTQHYPGHAAAMNGHVAAVWPTRMRQYGDGNVGMFNCPSAPAGFQWKVVTGTPGGVYANTSEVAVWGYRLGERLLVVGGGSGMPFTYGYNDWGSWNTLKNPQRGLGGDLNFGFVVPELRKSLVAAPSSMIAIADNVNDGNWDFNIDPTNPTEGVGKLHFDGANVLFADGHVEWELTTKWMNINAATTAGQEMARRWNNHNKHTADQN